MLRQKLNRIFYNARRRVVGLFKSSYDAATLCFRWIVLSEDRKAKRKEYVAPYADRWQLTGVYSAIEMVTWRAGFQDAQDCAMWRILRPSLSRYGKDASQIRIAS